MVCMNGVTRLEITIGIPTLGELVDMYIHTMRTGS